MKQYENENKIISNIISVPVLEGHMGQSIQEWIK